MTHETARPADARTDAQLPSSENEELRARLRELEETLAAIHGGDVDALVVNGALYVLESAQATTDRLRRDVLNQMEDAVFAFDAEGCVMFANPAAERRYKVIASDAMGKPQDAVFREDAAARDGLAGTAAGLVGRTARHRLNDGSTIDVEMVASPLIGRFGETLGSLSVIRDVTQRRAAEARRAVLASLTETQRDAPDPEHIGFEASALLGRAVNAWQVGYGFCGPDGADVAIGEAWCADGPASIAGTWEAAPGAQPGPGAAGRALLVVDDCLQDRRTWPLAQRLDDRVRAFVHVALVEQGRMAALLVVQDRVARTWTDDELDFIREFAERTQWIVERARNAQALRRSEAQLRLANERLEATVAARTRALTAAEEALRQSQKMEAIGQLTGGLAHDFNNLLGGVSASLQVLQGRLHRQQFEDIDRYIGMGREAVDRAASLTQRLLAFARRQTLDPRPVDLNRLIAGLEDLIRRTVGPSIRVEVACAAALWPTRTDVSQLENSLLNLCINARDAMLSGGGEVRLETFNTKLDTPELPARGIAAGDYVALCVTDSGSGMSEDVITHIFDPFFTTKPLGQGTGLGLSMVYGFVRQSGGDIGVESVVGQGTRMCLYLPRYFGEVAEEPEAPVDAAIKQGAGETVLVIEDEATIRELTEEILVEAGYRVLTADTGAAGLLVLQSTERIDLLLTDVGLPGGLNGRQVADAARLQRPGLKVLFMTGYAQSAAGGGNLLADGMQVLTKPFDIAVLMQRVREIITGA